ncbi:MAG: FAD-dependent oxidoreductase, partial [Myxococcota bacterium]|nr:FAD-dependent oxidoreductase [Myxococcota bacterium]
CEALKYPGGCASTFEKNDLTFEAGATLFSGFDDGQFFHKWINEYSLPVSFHKIDPSVCFRYQDLEIPISPNREETIDRICSLPNAPQKNLRAFFRYQKQIADILWPIFDDPHRLPPFSLNGLLWHLKRAWRYPLLLPLIGKPLIKVLKKYKLDGFAPFVQYCNALCQITIQTDIYRAEAPFALCTMDYLFRGTGHIEGGIGKLANALIDQIQTLDGDVKMPARVRSIERKADSWIVRTRQDEFQSRSIIANILPSSLKKLCHQPLRKRENELQKSIDGGWGAAMLYLVLKNNSSMPQEAHHIQCILHPEKKLEQGNHIFCSIGSATEQKDPTLRTATVSTHVPLQMYKDHPNAGLWIQEIQDRMKRCLFEKIPEIQPHIIDILPASPRTFDRFTKRPSGAVGGIPRTVGWHNYNGLFPKETLPNLWLVGDSVFPGQSTLSTTIGGVRTAHALLKKLR